MLSDYRLDLPEFARSHRIRFAVFEPLHFDRMVARHVALQRGRVPFFGGHRSRGRGKQRGRCSPDEKYHVSFEWYKL